MIVSGRASMVPDRRQAHEVLVTDLRSRFIEGFRTAEAAPAYLMEHVDVVWRRAPAVLAVAEYAGYSWG
jgi:hypothetical protein